MARRDTHHRDNRLRVEHHHDLRRSPVVHHIRPASHLPCSHRPVFRRLLVFLLLLGIPHQDGLLTACHR
jgi:hypothetical protein